MSTIYIRLNVSIAKLSHAKDNVRALPYQQSELHSKANISKETTGHSAKPQQPKRLYRSAYAHVILHTAKPLAPSQNDANDGALAPIPHSFLLTY